MRNPPEGDALLFLNFHYAGLGGISGGA